MDELPAKIFRVSTDISLKDHDYVPKEKKVHKEEAFKERSRWLFLAK